VPHHDLDGHAQGVEHARAKVLGDAANRVDELVNDLQAQLAGCFVPVPQQDGSVRDMPATPVTFLDYTVEPKLPVPEVGQHTEEILVELGMDWDRIVELKEKRVIN
jgi:crotonobetainyl-CoA:carnitine CoA-transferase CaiB-like acyl-CoA transferase